MDERKPHHHQNHRLDESSLSKALLKEKDELKRIVRAKDHDFRALVQESFPEAFAELKLMEKNIALLHKSYAECRARNQAEEEKLELTKRTLNEREEILHQMDQRISGFQGEMNACCREIEAKHIEIAAIRLSVEEQSRELEMTKKQLEILKNQISECEKELRLKREACNWQQEMLQQLVKERDEVRERMQNEIKEFEKDFAAKKTKLFSIQGKITESEKELKMKSLLLDQILEEIQNSREKHQAEQVEFTKRIADSNAELRRKEEELDAVRKLFDEQGREVEYKRTNLLNSAGEKMNQLVFEAESHQKECDSLMVSMKERIAEIESKKNRLDGRGKELEAKEEQFEERAKWLKEKERQVNEMNNKEKELEEISNEIKLREKQFQKRVNDQEMKEIGVQIWVSDLLKKAQNIIGQIQEFEARETLCAWRKKELASKEEQYQERKKELASKEEQYQERVQALEAKTKQVEERDKKLDLRDEHVEKQAKDSLFREASIEALIKKLESKEKNFESKQYQFEEKVKNWKLKEVHIKEELKDLESREKLYAELMDKLEAKEEQIEAQVKNLESKRKQCEEQMNVLRVKESKMEAQAKDLKLKRSMLEEQEKDLEIKVNQFKSLRRSFAREKVLKENSNMFLLRQPKIAQLDRKHAPQTSANVEKLPDNQVTPTNDGGKDLLLIKQTDEPELIISDILDNLKTSSDPAKLVLDTMLKHIAQHDKNGEKSVIIDADHILLLEQLMRISPHVKPHVRDEALKLALDLKAKMSAMTGNSLVVLCFLLILSVYGLASSFDESDVLKLFEIAAEHKQSVELIQTTGFVDKVYDFVQNLVKNQQYIEAVSFICAYKLSDKIQPIDLLRQHIQTARKDSIEQEVKAKDTEITTLKTVLQCVSDNKLELSDLVKEIQDQINDLEMQKLQQYYNEEKKRGSETVNSNYNNYQPQQQQYWVDQSNNKRPRTCAPFHGPPNSAPMYHQQQQQPQQQQQHVFMPLNARGAPAPNGVNPQYGFPFHNNNNNYYAPPANPGAGQYGPTGPNNFYQHGPYPRPPI